MKQISGFMWYGTARQLNYLIVRGILCHFGTDTACFTCRGMNARMDKTSANPAHVCRNSAPCPSCFATWTKTATWPRGMTTPSGCRRQSPFPWCLFRMQMWSPSLVAAACVRRPPWSWRFTAKAWSNRTVQKTGNLCGEATASLWWVWRTHRCAADYVKCSTKVTDFTFVQDKTSDP